LQITNCVKASSCRLNDIIFIILIEIETHGFGADHFCFNEVKYLGWFGKIDGTRILVAFQFQNVSLNHLIENEVHKQNPYNKSSFPKYLTAQYPIIVHTTMCQKPSF